MKCLGLDEAATRLAVQPSTLRRWARDLKIESVRLGRRVVFRESALEEFIKAGIRKSLRVTAAPSIKK
jgi:excisionase family DNA binding protein